MREPVTRDEQGTAGRDRARRMQPSEQQVVNLNCEKSHV